MKDLEHPLEDMDVVLGSFAPEDHLHVAGADDPLGMGRGERTGAWGEVGPGVDHELIEPELHPSRPSFGGLQHLGQDVLIGSKQVAREVQPMRK